MRHLRRDIMLGAVLVAVMAAIGCGGGGGSSSTAVNINSLDGQADIPVNSTFQYNFAQTVNSATVTAGSFFIVPATAPAAQTVKAAFDPTACDATRALAALVSCDGPYSCTLDPDADLEGNTLYSICLSPEILLGMG